MSVLLYLGMLMIHHRNLSSANGSDVLVMVIAFYVMFCPCGAAYSRSPPGQEARDLGRAV